MRLPFIYINGWPGVGKHTIARELKTLLGGHGPVKVIHNHLHIDLAGALLDRSSPGYQTLRRRLRSVLFETLTTDPSTFGSIYIFTDFNCDNDLGTSVANEYASAAQARGCAFIPVVLTCAMEENVRRMRSPERVELVRMGKGLLLDTEVLEVMRGNQGLFRFRRHGEVELDVGDMRAEQAARVIGEHVKGVIGATGMERCADEPGEAREFLPTVVRYSIINKAVQYLLASPVSTTAQTYSASRNPTIRMNNLLLPQHTFLQNASLSAGLTRYPITPGHSVIICHGSEELLSMNLSNFQAVLNAARTIFTAVSSVTKVHRYGLVNDGSGNISLIPLHGLSKSWKPVLHEAEEFNDIFSGYLTSKNGPRITEETLDSIRTTIGSVTGIEEPFNRRFDGVSTDQNLFARIVRGELPQWRIWEDDLHVAFLTPFGNTPGYTVLVPRKHLSSDIFTLNDEDYADIIKAAYTVAQHLKAAFSLRRCGMIFEGYEVDYAHVKLIPVHDQQLADGSLRSPAAGPACFQETYPGYLTSQLGPLASDHNQLSELATRIRESLTPTD